MIRMNLRILLFLGLMAVCLHPSANAAQELWSSVGPEGGDARSFAANPENPTHLLMGTTNSWIYESNDDGTSWHRLAKLGVRDDLVIDNLVIDSANQKIVFAAVWTLDHLDGGLFISHDGGVSWEQNKDMDGQSIRALAQASSDPETLIAGTMTGVYRSQNGGTSWSRISPSEIHDLHEVESIAIDPADPKIIYAGTWHLPWKTTDGGVSWHNIKNGLIDDSDVFSIIVDPKTPAVVYASACSGIYKSDNRGDLFHKVQGIPSTARRTRVLLQDPTDLGTVYAGTTEGLYKTTDSGTRWSRMTGGDVIVNDVYVDPKNPLHVLLATDRGGIMLSNDSARSFHTSNTGFTQRQVAALLFDPARAERLYAGVLNDKTYGGVFVSENSGSTWEQRSQGLNGNDVLSLGLADDGTLLAGTEHGIFRWASSEWKPANTVVEYKEEPKPVVQRKHRTKTASSLPVSPGKLDSRIRTFSLDGDTWFAGGADGLYKSKDQAKSWQPVPMFSHSPIFSVQQNGETVYVATRASVVVSKDGGQTWEACPAPKRLTSVRSLAKVPDGNLWIGGPEGIYWSKDDGHSWFAPQHVPIADINYMGYSPELERVLVTSQFSTLILAIDDKTQTWKRWDAGTTMRNAHFENGRMFAASMFDGVIIGDIESARR